MSYQESLDKATGAARVPSEFLDEQEQAAPPLNIDQCWQWLQAVGFPQDAATWQRIKTKWIAFLSATSKAPDNVLAPDKKLIRFEDDTDSERFRNDRDFRLKVRWAVTGSPDCDNGSSLTILESKTERWPHRARVFLNKHDPLRHGEALETLAPIWELARRQRAMSMWTTMVSFAQYCHGDNALEGLGLKLDEEAEDDLFDISHDLLRFRLRLRQAGSGLTDTWHSLHRMFSTAMRQPQATARNNLILWWMGIHVMSAALGPGQDDYITRGRFRENPIPMDLDLRGRAAAMTYYAKVITLDDALHEMAGAENVLVKEIQDDLNSPDLSWVDVEGGRRPVADSHAGACSGEAWAAMLRILDGAVTDVFAKEKGTAMARIVELEGLWAGQE
ncbi:hypothetical protein B0T11DRAFT_340345 [Plectosphaerella cucumerina]|uniref:Uncharacterized protein n=1 Tax=Plectosphaerella cucumerina TaxID=40658 RepID=A0A8K0TBK1_9PEZI|nr:hypothetical protein B0T11DRAFT_340345 [Plectosphaerella cucumerina]